MIWEFRQLGTDSAHVLALLLVCLMFGAPSNALARDCGTRAVTQRETTVFESPATSFNTASGWVYGRPAAVLASNIRVFVCGNRTVRFGVITQSWMEIAYWDGQRWQYGWVVADSLTVGNLESKSTLLASIMDRLLSISVAHAETPLIKTNPPPDLVTPPPPERPSVVGFASAEDSALSSFYGVLFVCMILGMLGKVLFDALTSAERLDWKARARGGVVPLLVSPIVFLGIMKAADITATAELTSFISLACVAFQNGFFWHTLFDRTSGAS